MTGRSEATSSGLERRRQPGYAPVMHCRTVHSCSRHVPMRSFLDDLPPKLNVHDDDVRSAEMSFYVTSVSYRTVAARGSSWLALAGSLANFDTFKTALCVYVLLTRSAKAYRHVRARGVLETIQDGYSALLEVSCAVRLNSLTRA